MTDLASLANHFRQSHPEASPLKRAEFLTNVLAALNAKPALATDSLPFNTRSTDRRMSRVGAHVHFPMPATLAFLTVGFEDQN